MTGPPDLEEVARLRSEVDDLRRRLAATGDRRGPTRGRRVLAALLVALAVVTVPLAVAATWARRTVVDESEFVAVVGPLPREPAVQEALTDYLSTQVLAAVDPEALFTRALPERGRILAVPLATAVEGFVTDRVEAVVRSKTFARLWEDAARRAHAAALAVLRGEGDALRVEGGDVVLDLVPVLGAVLAAIEDASPSILGRDVTLPEITSAELPQEARVRIERALGRDLPEDFGSLVVFRSDELVAVQDGAQLAQRGVVVLVLAAVASATGAVAVSPSRRRTLLQLAVGIALGTVLLRRIGLRVQAQVLGLVPEPTNRAAVEVVTDRLLSGLLSATGAVLVVCLALAVGALVTGPSRAAVRLRDAVVGLVRGVVGGTVRHTGPLDRWVPEHADLLRGAAAVVAALVLLIAELSWWGVALLLAVTAAVEVRLARLASVEGSGPGPDP